MNVKVIARNIGFALLVSALFMFISIGVSLLDGNDSALFAFIISFTITFIVGIFPFIFVRSSSLISLKEGYVIIVLSWLLSFIFGALPYMLWGGPFTPINAFFESVSGFTTTGATILRDIECLPKSLLFWRSSTHFIGGLGVVVFLLLMMQDASPVRLRLTSMEVSSLSREVYAIRTGRVVYVFTYVYLALVLSSFVAYLLCGMSVFDAVNHAFSVCATGGFSTRNLSIAGFESTAVSFVTMLFMLLASVHFGVLFLAVVNYSVRPVFTNPVLKFYLLGIVIIGLWVSCLLKLDKVVPSWDRAFMEGFFQTISFSSTTGFALSDNSVWPIFPSVLLVLIAFHCGMAGSTTGGVKSDRMLILLKALKKQIFKSLHPSSVSEIKIGSKVLHDEEAYPHVLYIALYCLLVLISFLLSMMAGVDIKNSIVASLSCFGNVGPALGEMGTFGNYDSLNVLTKLLYSVDMFLGRLEIYPLMAVVTMIFSKKE